MSHADLLGGFPRPVMAKIRLIFSFAMTLFWIQVSPAQAHGAHATFISPGNRAQVSGDMLVHVKKLSAPIPYAHITIRNVSTGVEQWSGLVAESHAGYTQTIELDGWAAGPYDIETQFVGDIVEQVQRRRVIVVVSD